MLLDQVDPNPLPLFALVPWAQSPRGGSDWSLSWHMPTAHHSAARTQWLLTWESTALRCAVTPGHTLRRRGIPQMEARIQDTEKDEGNPDKPNQTSPVHDAVSTAVDRAARPSGDICTTNLRPAALRPSLGGCLHQPGALWPQTVLQRMSRLT